MIGISEQNAPVSVRAYMNALRTGNTNSIMDKTNMKADMTHMWCEKEGIASDIIKLMIPKENTGGMSYVKFEDGVWKIEHNFNPGQTNSRTVISYIILDSNNNIINLEAEVW